MKKTGVNWALLAHAIQTRMAETGKARKDISREANVGLNIIQRAMHGKSLGSESYTKLCAWLKVPAGNFVEGLPNDYPEASTLEKIEAALFRDPRLTKEQAIELAEMMRAAYRALV